MDTQHLEELPHREAGATQEAQPAAQAVEGRGLALKAIEKITSLKVFGEQKQNLIDYVDRKTNEAISKGAQRLASFAEGIPLSRGGQERAAAATGVQQKLEANTARFTAALAAFKERIQVGTKEALTAAPAAAPEKEQAKTPETRAERREKVIEGAQEKRASLFKRVLSEAADLIPFAGGAKMAFEAVRGKTAVGGKLTGTEQIMHGAMGVACVVLDATGIGEVARLTGKSISLIGKVGEKLAEKGAARGARLMAKTAGFMATHPRLVLKGEEWADKQIVGAVKKVAAYRKGEREAA